MQSMISIFCYVNYYCAYICQKGYGIRIAYSAIDILEFAS